MKNDTLRKNPSRKTREDTIKRILTAEINETGHNTHFKNASILCLISNLFILPPMDLKDRSSVP